MKTSAPKSQTQSKDEKKPANSVKKALSTIYAGPTNNSNNTCCKENLVTKGKNHGDCVKMKDPPAEKTEFPKLSSTVSKVLVYEDTPELQREDYDKQSEQKIDVEDDGNNKNITTSNKSIDAAVTEMKPICTNSNKVIAQDLTDEAGPSEKYWEVMAERRRIALQDTIGENRILRERVKLLEEENTELKELMANATDIINHLQEILDESNNAQDQDKTKDDLEQSVSDINESNISSSDTSTISLPE